MSARFLTAALCLAPLVLSAAQAQTLVPFSDPKLPFTMSLPQGWLGADFGDDTPGVSVVSAKQPPASMIRMLYMNKGGAKININNEFKQFEAGVKATGANVQVVAGKNVTYSGVPGVVREYLVTHDQGKLRMRVWYGNGGTNMYSFQLTDTPQRFTQASAIFNKVVATVQFKK